MEKMYRLIVPALVVAGMCLTGGVAHAQSSNGVQPTATPHWNGYSGTTYTYSAAQTATPSGASTVPIEGGSEVLQSSVAIDYGQISNIFLARFAPVLSIVGIAGAVIVAGSGAVHMILARMRGVFH